MAAFSSWVASAIVGTGCMVRRRCRGRDPNLLARESTLLEELEQCALYLDVQALGELAFGRAVEERVHGGNQRAGAREPYRLPRPQTSGVEAGDFPERVATTADVSSW